MLKKKRNKKKNIEICIGRALVECQQRWDKQGVKLGVMLPDSEVLGVTEATGICGMEAEEKVEYEDAQEVMGEEEEVTGEFFSRLGEFSHALRADSIYERDRKKGMLK